MAEHDLKPSAANQLPQKNTLHHVVRPYPDVIINSENNDYYSASIYGTYYTQLL
jgi:hypothetical protein